MCVIRMTSNITSTLIFFSLLCLEMEFTTLCLLSDTNLMEITKFPIFCVIS